MKNKFKLGGLLWLICVLLSAIVMVGLYPFFRSEAKRKARPVYETGDFSEKLMSGNRILSVEAMQQLENIEITPFDYFFGYEMGENYTITTDAESGENLDQAGEISLQIGTVTAVEAGRAKDIEDYKANLKSQLNRDFEGWKREFDTVRRYIDYQVLDEEGKVLLSRGPAENLKEAAGYEFKTVLHYDANGRLEIVHTDGLNPESIWNRLEERGSNDPMQEYYWDEFRYEAGLTYQNPRNLTFVYAMTPEMAVQYTDSLDSYQKYSDWSSAVYAYICLAILIAAVAFLSSFTKAFRMNYSRVVCVPLEIVIGLVMCACALGYSLLSLIDVTNSGGIGIILVRMGFTNEIVNDMVLAWNVMWWSIPFAIFYWASASISEVFHIGLWTYLKHRTLIGIVFTGIWRMGGKIYSNITDIDLRDRHMKLIWKIVLVNFIVLAVICSFWFFGIFALLIYSIALFALLKKYYQELQNKYNTLLAATNQIAEGNLDIDVPEDLGIFEPLKRELEKIQKGFKVAVDEELKSQNMKTDLITNVSHDLKTPLTAIITYVNLLKEENTTPEQRKSYITVLEQRSMRLKALIEDLFEMSKATSHNVTLNPVDINIVSLLKQVVLELGDKIDSSDLDFRFNLPEERVMLHLDSQKTYRIFENLLTNIIKYAMPKTRAYIDMSVQDDNVVICMKNVSSDEMNFDPNDITDRFIRGDASRNTEGSGLGLAIAKSFVELQGGRFAVEVEADLFRVIIRWPLVKTEEPSGHHETSDIK